MQSFNPNTTYAVVIGNNIYPNKNGWYSLQGAVNDATDFRNFLGEIHIPNANIRFMTNATHAQIYQFLLFLKEGRFEKEKGVAEQIPQGSGFIFFYAGHGARSEMPKSWKRSQYWTPDDLVEQLVPSDIGPKHWWNPCDQVNGITDRAIVAALDGLIDAIRCDNVTIILDCCHSMGATRGPRSADIVVRRLENVPALPDDVDSSLLKLGQRRRGAPSLSRSAQDGSSGIAEVSHMLLAACQQDQFAGERREPSRGRFTVALLEVLRRGIHNLSYAGLMLQMPIVDHRCLQTPGCHGVHQDRLIFATQQGRSTKNLYVGRTFNNDDAPLVYGGLAHGFSTGDVLKLYDLDTERTPLGEAKIDECFAVCATLSFTTANIPAGKTFYCEPSLHGSVYFDTSSVQGLPEEVTLMCADELDKADVVITNSTGRRQEDKVLLAFVNRGENDVFSAKHGCQYLTAVPKKDVMDVLKVMFRFKQLLAIPKSTWGSQASIDIDFHEVNQPPTSSQTTKTEVSHVWRKGTSCARVPAEPFEYQVTIDALESGGSNTDQRQFGKSKSYGLSITNKSEMQLFVSVISLSAETLSITPHYLSTYSAVSDVPLFLNEEDPNNLKIDIAGDLHPNHCKPIGYSNSGVQPFRYLVDHQLEADRTFLKVILTSTPADFSMFAQTNPVKDLEVEGYRRVAVCRAPVKELDFAGKLADARNLANRLQTGSLAQDYFSTIVCVEQNKVENLD